MYRHRSHQLASRVARVWQGSLQTKGQEAELVAGQVFNRITSVEVRPASTPTAF